MNLPRRVDYILWGIVLAGYCAAYYAATIHRLPFGVHAWAQADRLSLAIGYYDNGMNFFLPSTLNQTSVNGVTGVECPLQSYLAAVGGLLFGRAHISLCFRLLDILITVAGLHALFLIVYRRTGRFIMAAFTPLTIFSAPVFIYYAGNYLPDPASVSVTFIAFYFFYDFAENPARLKRLYPALCLFTLAALLKASAGIYLLAAIVFALVRLRQMSVERKGLLKLLIVSFILVCLPVLQYGYIRWLNHVYHSILFLAKPVPLFRSRDWQDFGHAIASKWLWQYLTLPQYLVIIAVSVAGYRSVPRRSDGHGLYMKLCLAGALIVLLLFGGQYDVHDYYVIAPWYPLLAYALLHAVRRLSERKTDIVVTNAGSLATGCILLIFFAAGYLANYRNLYQYRQLLPVTPSRQWMEGGATMLQKAGVPQSARIVVLGDDSPNTGLVYFDRKGLTAVTASQAVALMDSLHFKLLICNSAAFRKPGQAGDTALRGFRILTAEGDKMGLVRTTSNMNF